MMNWRFKTIAIESSIAACAARHPATASSSAARLPDRVAGALKLMKALPKRVVTSIRACKATARSRYSSARSARTACSSAPAATLHYAECNVAKLVNAAIADAAAYRHRRENARRLLKISD